MSSKPDPDTEALFVFTARTQAFINGLLDDAQKHNFCPACAVNFAAHLVVAAAQATPHDRDAATDELRPTAFDDNPGHA